VFNIYRVLRYSKKKGSKAIPFEKRKKRKAPKILEIAIFEIMGRDHTRISNAVE
jgi:hypothetical protein